MNNRLFDRSKQRWSLRKSTIGLTSVLLGITLLTFSQKVNADEIHPAATVQIISDATKDDSTLKQQGDKQEKQQTTATTPSEGATTQGSTSVQDSKTTENSSNATTQDEGKQSQSSHEIKAKDEEKSSKSLDEKRDEDSDKPSLSDLEKYKQLKYIPQDDINKRIKDKYEKILNDAIKDGDWEQGLPTWSDFKDIKGNQKTFITANEPSQDLNPLVNNTIHFKGSSYKYVNKNGQSSLYGFIKDDSDTDYHLMTQHATKTLWGVPVEFSNNYCYYFYTKDKNNNYLILEKKADFNDHYSYNGNYHYEVVKQPDGSTKTVRVKDDNDNKGETHPLNLEIREYLICTPEGNIIHNIRFINDSSSKDLTEVNRTKYFTLNDTKFKNNDGVPIYSTGNHGVYITDRDMVYGVRTLAGSSLSVTNYSDASKELENYKKNDTVVDETYKTDSKIGNYKDTAIRISSPESNITKKGDKTEIWYIETAFENPGKQNLSDLIDKRFNLPVQPWIDKINQIIQQKESEKDTEGKIKTGLETGEKGLQASDQLKDKIDHSAVKQTTTDTQAKVDVINKYVHNEEGTKGIIDVIKDSPDSLLGKKGVWLKKGLGFLGFLNNGFSKLEKAFEKIDSFNKHYYKPLLKASITLFNEKNKQIKALNKIVNKLRHLRAQVRSSKSIIQVKRKINRAISQIRSISNSFYKEKLNFIISKAKGQFTKLMNGKVKKLIVDGIINMIEDGVAGLITPESRIGKVAKVATKVASKVKKANAKYQHVKTWWSDAKTLFGSGLKKAAGFVTNSITNRIKSVFGDKFISTVQSWQKQIVSLSTNTHAAIEDFISKQKWFKDTFNSITTTIWSGSKGNKVIKNIPFLNKFTGIETLLRNASKPVFRRFALLDSQFITEMKNNLKDNITVTKKHR